MAVFRRRRGRTVRQPLSRRTIVAPTREDVMGEQPSDIRQDFLANRDIIMEQGPDAVAAMNAGMYRGAHRQMADQVAGLPSVTPEIGRQVINQVLPQQRAPTQYGSETSYYRPSTGQVNISEQDRQRLPVNVYVHEQSHAQQTPMSAHAQDLPLRGSDLSQDRAARELAPSLAGNIADYEARRRGGAGPLTGGIQMAPGYEPSLEWMRQMAEKHGMFSGKQMESLLAQNPQYVKMLAGLYGRKMQHAYESGSIRPIPIASQ